MPHQLGLEQFSFRLKTMDSAVLSATSKDLVMLKRNYAVIEKEALASIWAYERLEEYVLGLSFTLETNHKPLVPLLTTTALSKMPPRILRFRLRMMRYNPYVLHVPGKRQISADAHP